MRAQQVRYLNSHEQGLVDLLIAIGTRRNIANVLVFLANVPSATSRDIERGTDLRQPEVSLAMSFLIEKGWIRNSERKSENKGRPVKIYTLSGSLNAILDTIEQEQKERAQKNLAALKKLRSAAPKTTGKK